MNVKKARKLQAGTVDLSHGDGDICIVLCAVNQFKTLLFNERAELYGNIHRIASFLSCCSIFLHHSYCITFFWLCKQQNEEERSGILFKIILAFLRVLMYNKKYLYKGVFYACSYYSCWAG